MNAKTVLQRSTDVTYQVVADEAILIRMSTGTYFSLNKVGTDFWLMLNGTQSVQQHAESIASKYNVDTPTVVGDLLELAEKMIADKLVDSV